MIKFYAVYYFDTNREGETVDLNDEPMLTFCAKRKDCIEYIDKYIQIKHRKHFLDWCSLRDLDPTDDKSWFEYSKANVDEKYVIRKVKYSKKQISSMIRMLLEALPLDCSFEETCEKEYFLFNNLVD